MDDMMPQAGFKNVQMKQATLSPDGAVSQFVIVGEKN